MGELFDGSRKMQLTTPLGRDALALTDFTGTEEISRLYKFELNVHSPRRKPIEFSSLLGQDIRVEIELPNPGWANSLATGKLPPLKHRRFCGLVQEITELASDTYFNYYQLILQPRFWLWTQKSDCRIFQEQTVGEILKAMLEGLNVDFRLHSNYQKRPYCVQYNESSYDFVTRLMAEEGIFYYFEHQYEAQDNQHRHQGERLVVTDSVVNLPPIESPENADGQVPQLKFDEVVGGQRSELRINRWHRAQRIVSNKCTLRDHTFQLPGQSLETNEEVPEQVNIGRESHKLAPLDHELEVYEYPGQYAKQFDGIGPGGDERPAVLKSLFEHNGAFSKRQVERHASDSIRIAGASDCPHLVPGRKFSLFKDQVVSGPYFVKSVHHIARLNGEFRSQGNPAASDPKEAAETADHVYSNEFICQADVLPFQTTRKRAPRIFGFQTATVVGPAGEEIFSDKFGRIKVQFHWDRKGTLDADSSCWIRVAQVWAGNRWGAFFWPRVGHEVVVAFENGDPDLPLIIGSVYNAKNMPPLALPDRLSSSGIKSCTLAGNPLENFSCVVFHDGEGAEYLQLHSETHECLTSETAKLNYSNGLKVDFQGGQEHILGLFGSGSGGGPSVNEAGTVEQISPGNEPPEHSTIRELDQILAAFGCQGSGSGGLLSSWLGSVGVPKRGGSAAEAAEEAGVGNEIGSFEMITGGSGLTRLGSDLENLFGRDAKVVCDVESVIDSLMNPISWILGSPLTNGGYFHQVYGQKQDIMYGRELKVHRGETLEVHQPGLFKGVTGSLGELTYGEGIALLTSRAVFCVAILSLVFSIAVSIIVKALMETPPETEETHSQPPGESESAKEAREQRNRDIEHRNSRKLDHWKKIITRWQFWSKECQLNLISLECFLERLFCRVTKLEKDTKKTAVDIAGLAWYLTRIYPWTKTELTASQKTKLAAINEKKTMETITAVALVLGLFVVAPAVIIPAALNK